MLQTGGNTRVNEARIRLAEFYALQIFPRVASLQEALETGSEALLSMTPNMLKAGVA